MALLKKFIFGFAILIVAFVAVGFILPSQFSVERSVAIKASPEEVFEQIVDLRKWQNWGVWFKRDPGMTVEYSGPEAAVGMKSVWQSDSEGSGEMQLTAVEPQERVIYSLYFPDFDMGSTGELILTQQDGQTLVTWKDYGDVGSNPINHYFALMMDSMVGPDFEMGLENLKTLVENQK